MRRTSYNAILERLALLNGLQPADVLETDRAGYEVALADALKLGWELAFWPEITVVEERAYMDAWAAAAIYAVGARRYYAATKQYFQAAATTAPGESPQTHPAKWTVLTDVDSLVATEQAGKVPLGTVRFITVLDPRLNRNPIALPWSLHGDGVRVDGTRVPPTVFVTFRLRCEDWQGPLFAPTAAYAAGKVIYYSSANEPGDYWEVVLTTTAGQTPESAPTKWRRLEIPWILQEFAARHAFGGTLRAEGENDKARGEEDRAYGRLYREMDNIEGLSRQVSRYTVVAPNA